MANLVYKQICNEKKKILNLWFKNKDFFQDVCNETTFGDKFYLQQLSKEILACKLN